VRSLTAGAIGAALGARSTFAISGALFIATAGISWTLLVGRTAEPARQPDLEPEPEPQRQPLEELPLSVDQLERSVYADAD
jgi:hypothetical protein